MRNADMIKNRVFLIFLPLVLISIFLVAFSQKVNAQCSPGYSCYPKVTVDLYKCINADDTFDNPYCEFSSFDEDNDSACNDQVACETDDVCSSNDGSKCGLTDPDDPHSCGWTSACSPANCCFNAEPSPTPTPSPGGTPTPPPPSPNRFCSITLSKDSNTTTATTTVTLQGRGQTSGTETVEAYLVRKPNGASIDTANIIGAGTVTPFGPYPPQTETYYKLGNLTCSSTNSAVCNDSINLRIAETGLFNVNCNVVGAGAGNVCTGNPFCSLNGGPLNCSDWNNCTNDDNKNLTISGPPTCGGFTVSATNIDLGDSVTLTATNVTDTNGISNVYFYYSPISPNYCDTRVSLGVGSLISANTYRKVWNTFAPLEDGDYYVWAEPEDSSSPPVTCTGIPSPASPALCGDTSVCANCRNTITIDPPVVPTYNIEGRVFIDETATYNLATGRCEGSTANPWFPPDTTNNVSFSPNDGTGGQVQSIGTYIRTGVNGSTSYAATLNVISSGWDWQCRNALVNVGSTNIAGVNFFVKPELSAGAWWQVVGGHAHANGGQLSSQVPAAPIAPRFFSLQGAGSGIGLAGIATNSLNQFPSFNNLTNYRQPDSESQYIAKDTDYLILPPSALKEDYDYFYSLFKMPASPTDDFTGSNGSDSSRPANKPTAPPAGGNTAYYQNGSLYVSGQNFWNVGAGESITVFVEEDLHLMPSGSGTVNSVTTDPTGGFLAFVVKNNIYIYDGVGSSSASYTSPAHIQGVYIANNIIQSAYPGTILTNKLIADGMFIGWNGFNLNRSLSGTSNNDYPAEIFRYRPDLLLKTPALFKKPGYTWEEIAP